MTADRRNLPMSAAEMRAHATAAGECPHCDLMWRGFVASTADVDRLRETRDALSGLLRRMARKVRFYDQIGATIAGHADVRVAGLREIEQRARSYVEAVDRGRELGIPGLGLPVLHFQPLRTALGIGPFLGDGVEDGGTDQ